MQPPPREEGRIITASFRAHVIKQASKHLYLPLSEKHTIMQKYIVSLLTYSVAALCDVNRNSKQQRQLERRQDGGEKLFVVMVVGDSADIIR